MSSKEAPAQNGLDPDVASLLEIEQPEPVAEPAAANVGGDAPGSRISARSFGDEKPAATKVVDTIDTTRQKFPTITKFQDEPRPYFQDKEYYKKVLAGEGEEGTRLHDLLGKYMKAEDPEEKSHVRAQLITRLLGARRKGGLPCRAAGSWSRNASCSASASFPPVFSRPSFVTWCRGFPSRTAIGEPVWYVDEWLERISKGLVRPSTVDEIKVKGKDSGQKILDAVEKKKGQRDSEITILKAKVSQLEEREGQLRSQVEMLMRHDRSEEYGGVKTGYNASQKAALAQIQEILRQLSTLDGQITASYADLASIDKDLENLGRKSEGITSQNVVDQKSVVGEWSGSLRQMAKMCCGRQGNHFPIFISQFVRPILKEIGTRENVIKEMAMVESLDPGLFLRTYKSQTTRIVPNIILMASYGDTGICWEPFEKFNRATSRGRVAIPMFSKSLPVAVMTAMADLRWQVAKEKAQYYWMEEGITGKYYQWFTERKLRGDVREYFIRDYALWINKESQGMQKLDKEVRGIFWRMLPFPQHIKDNLRNRGFVYNDLYKKDQNIAKSDGY